jgi:hypothetical protein
MHKNNKVGHAQSPLLRKCNLYQTWEKQKREIGKLGTPEETSNEHWGGQHSLTNSPQLDDEEPCHLSVS